MEPKELSDHFLAHLRNLRTTWFRSTACTERNAAAARLRLPRAVATAHAGQFPGHYACDNFSLAADTPTLASDHCIE